MLVLEQKRGAWVEYAQTPACRGASPSYGSPEDILVSVRTDRGPSVFKFVVLRVPHDELGEQTAGPTRTIAETRAISVADVILSKGLRKTLPLTPTDAADADFGGSMSIAVLDNAQCSILAVARLQREMSQLIAQNGALKFQLDQKVCASPRELASPHGGRGSGSPPRRTGTSLQPVEEALPYEARVASNAKFMEAVTAPPKHARGGEGEAQAVAPSPRQRARVLLASMHADAMGRSPATEMSRFVDDVALIDEEDERTEDTLMAIVEGRFHERQIYTCVGQGTLVSVNPYEGFDLYGPDVIARYHSLLSRGVDVAPHVYVVAHSAYARLLAEGRSQTIICTGEAGSGKTEATKLAAAYLTQVSAMQSEARPAG